MLRNDPVSICKIKHSPSRLPNPQYQLIFEGAGKSTNIPFTIDSIGFSFNILISMGQASPRLSPFFFSQSSLVTPDLIPTLTHFFTNCSASHSLQFDRPLVKATRIPSLCPLRFVHPFPLCPWTLRRF